MGSGALGSGSGITAEAEMQARKSRERRLTNGGFMGTCRAVQDCDDAL
jgi:hypothetical protein